MRRERGEGRLILELTMACAKALRWERRECNRLGGKWGWSRVVEFQGGALDTWDTERLGQGQDT